MTDVPSRSNRASSDRQRWPVRIYRLGRDPGNDLSATSTAGERLGMLVVLSERMWVLSGWPLPSYPRSQLPVRVIRSS
ncbi:MAG: hypothetical protein ACREOJ_16250 [Gemmatimonadaceae bacterium]